MSIRPGWQSQASPGQRDHGALCSRYCCGRGLANCQTKGFPKVKLDVRDLNPARAIRLGTKGTKGTEGSEDQAETSCAETPAAVTGLDAGPWRSPRAVTDESTAVTTGHIKGCLRRDSLRRRSGWIPGDAQRDGWS